jgi:Holliday junction resolvase RusA-like endonuclease
VISLTLTGRPATKKNRGIPIQRKSKAGNSYTAILPNAEYKLWEQSVALQCRIQYKAKPLLESCVIRAVFYEHPMQRGDLGGYFDALCDALQHAGIVKNDRQFRATVLDIQRDADNPRVELTITPYQKAAA